jgi:hypothetical protein
MTVTGRDYKRLEQIKIERQEIADRLRELDENDQEWGAIAQECQQLSTRDMCLAIEFVDTYNSHDDELVARLDGALVILGHRTGQ